VDYASLQQSVDPFYQSLLRTGKLQDLGFSTLEGMTDPAMKSGALEQMKKLQDQIKGGSKLYSKDQATALMNAASKNLQPWQKDLLGFTGTEVPSWMSGGQYGQYYALSPEEVKANAAAQIKEKYLRDVPSNYQANVSRMLEASPEFQSFFKQRPLTEAEIARNEALKSFGVTGLPETGAWAMPYDAYYNLKNNPAYSSQNMLDTLVGQANAPIRSALQSLGSTENIQKFVTSANAALEKAGIKVPQVSVNSTRYSPTGSDSYFRLGYDPNTGNLTNWNTPAAQQAQMEALYPQLKDIRSAYEEKALNPANALSQLAKASAGFAYDPTTNQLTQKALGSGFTQYIPQAEKINESMREASAKLARMLPYLRTDDNSFDLYDLLR
jgi:hypothetical protein